MAGLPQEFGRLIEQVTRLLRRAFDARARAIGVTRVQWQTLMALAHYEGMGQAEMFEVEPITVSWLINRLQASGLVLRCDHPTDRRAHSLVLTDKARRLLAHLTPLAEACLGEALGGIESEEVERLSAMLERVRANLQTARQNPN